MTTFYLDPVNGNDAADGSTFALGGLPTVGPWKTITAGATAARIAPGDVIRIAKSPAPTSLGQTALWTNLSRDVVLQTGAVTANIDTGEAAWTASANVTGTADAAQFKEGSKSAKNSIAAGFTTGLAAYKAFAATDFSAYQQISFWIRNSAAFTAGQLQIKLCSDNAGVTSVNSFDIPAIPSTNQWVPITINFGSALGNSIQSVALYVATDFGAVDVYLDNLIACKAPGNDALTLQSLISKNSAAQGGTAPWFPIQSINGTTIKIDNHTNNLGNAGRGYTGTTETVTIYKRETIKTALVATSATTVQEFQDSGTLGSLIEFQGGYNTSNNTQDGETLFDGLNGFGTGLLWSAKSYIKMNWLGTIRYNLGYNIGYGAMIGAVLTNLRAVANGGSGFYGGTSTQALCSVGTMWLNNNGGTNGNFFAIQSLRAEAGTTLYLHGNLSAGLSCSNSTNHRLNNVEALNNGGAGVLIQATSDCMIQTLITADNAYSVQGGGPGVYIANFNYSESAPLSTSDPWYVPARIAVGNVNGVATDLRTLTRQGIIYSETSVRHTASGYAWKLSPTDTNVSAAVPLWLKVAEIAVNANAQVTVSAWMRRTNTGITGSLVCRGGQIAGVDSDVTASMTVGANTWEQVTITFTPTAAGVVEIEAWAYGGTTYSVYVDDLSVSQA